MLLYYSLRPQAELFPEGDGGARLQQVSDLLELITVNHYRNAADCFPALESHGLFLGNGGFIPGVLWSQRGKVFQSADLSRLNQILAPAKALLTTPVWYAYTCQGRIWFLLCYPRLQPSSPNCGAVLSDVVSRFERLQQALDRIDPNLRVMVGDLDFQERSIYLTANALSHAAEYADFRAPSFRLVHPVMADQLHNAFITDFSAYRKLSIQVTDTLTAPECDLKALVNDVIDRILTNSAPSMESLHHHLQIFILTLTDYLGSSGTVNASFLSRRQITARILHFENEGKLREQLLELLTEIRKQHRTLTGVGKQHRILEIRAYVDHQISDPELTVNNVADQFSIHPSLLTSQFRHYFGITLHQYIQRERQRRARELISGDPSLTMRQAAASAGYTDVSTMYRAFQKFEGIAPGVLKK